MDPLVESRPCTEVESLFRRRVGHIPPSAHYVCPHPWMYRVPLFAMNPKLHHVGLDYFMQIYFVITRDNACRFCYSTSRATLRVLGYSETELDRLERSLDVRGGEAARRDAFRFALRISQGQLDASSSIDSLRESGYGEEVIREIAGIGILTTVTNRVTTMLALPVKEKVLAATDTWYFKLLQPVVGRVLPLLRRLGTRSEPPLKTEDLDGPFALWLSRLEGTPVGTLLHQSTRDWLQKDSALPHRTKLLILAVVARGLSSEELVDRCCTLLPEVCEMPEPVFQDAVAHLRSEAISDAESKLLELARASIRYEAGRIQQTVRKHTRSLSRDETIDAVGAIALSNALARLRVLAPLD